MKVLVVGTGGGLAGSGITTMTDQLAATLSEMGHEAVRVVAGDRRRLRPNRLNLENVAALLQEVRAVWRPVRHHRPEVVWLNAFGVPLLPALRTLLLVATVRAAGDPVILQYHAFDLPGHLEGAGRLASAVMVFTGRMTSATVVLQPDAARALADRLDSPVAVLPNWLDVSHEPAPMPPSPPYRALFVGSLIARKGVPQLLEAIRLLDDVPLVLRVVGGPGDDGADAAKAIVDDAGDLVRGGRVELVGQLTPEQVRQEMDEAHVVVLPSRAEGMPVAVLEAMAAGRAVVVGGSAVMAELIGASDVGFVLESQAPTAIAQALRDAVDDPERLADRGARAFHVARTTFSRAAVAERLEELMRLAPRSGRMGRAAHCPR